MANHSHQGILNGEVSLYYWPPVWLVLIKLYDNWHFLFIILQNRLIQTSQIGGQRYSDISPFGIPCSRLYLIFAGKAGAYWSGATLGSQVTHSYIGKHSSSLQYSKNYCWNMFLV
jgi:hypothetical protein